ncbi:Ccr4-not core complex subunit [Scedosporium apiospermum]|uniref:poly(A)-specific ribonuclease n=1 Tax=Pseudallescheria apiosperma TaxID=563466 RepID=A0A084GBW5_PSEDA|nr:Ccr4-not core complex subunit [Scedosporium apiospermum]KEZ44827.1 Ccr4-not core complex subunit [Scedosporium apiospermum]
MPPHQISRFASGPTLAYHQQQQFQSHAAQSHAAAAHQPPLAGTHSYINANAQLNAFQNPTNGGLAGVGGLNSGGFIDGPRLAFQGAAGFQQQQQHGQAQHALGVEYPPNVRAQSNKGRIREVWKHNLHEEMATLRRLVDSYPYIAMDTEFPGVVSRPMGNFRGKSDYHYQCLRTNVDMLKVIQIGITLFNEAGETIPARPNSTEDALGKRGSQASFPCSWQFNFKFSLKDDMYNEKSIESLQSAGIDFNALERDGIDPHDFAALLLPSGLVLEDDVHWISFHGGYDFGYLTKLLMCTALPNDEVDFEKLMKTYFPSTFDVKHLMKYAIKLYNSGILATNDPSISEVLQKFEHKSGLENIAETLKIKRVGAAHQAGSDSLLTGKVFFQIRERIFGNEIAPEHVGKVWGLGVPDVLPHSLPATNSDLAATAGANGNGNGNGNNNNNKGNNGGPSTPNTGSVGLASTPGTAQTHHGVNGGSMGPMTPGGGGGVFGNFAFSGASR